MTRPPSSHAPGDRIVAADQADGTVAAFTLDGRACRIVCVDELVPSQKLQPGATRLQQRYRSDEVAHFQLGAHRYALVAPDVASAQARNEDDAVNGQRRDIHELLSNRELQIVQLICTGLLTKQVSDRLRISEFTVRSYLKTIYCKLGVRSRGAMVYAYAQSFARSSPSDGAQVDPALCVDPRAALRRPTAAE
jgi:DNA-binding CsgD family transcriptional regulator